MNKMRLRPYQEEAVKNVFECWKRRKNILLVLPTGTGKTIVFSTITKMLTDGGERVLILAHREELLQQAADKLKKAVGVDSVLEKAKDTALGSNELVTVGSVQTLQSEKRLSKFPKDYYDTIIIDEAHHALSKGYRNVINYFDDAKVLGVTATPDRGDKKNLSEIFDEIAYEYSLKDAIKDGYLSNIMVQTIPLSIDLQNVKISQGDYSVGDIGNAIEPYLEEIAKEMSKRCKNKKTVVFLPLVKTSQKFAAMLNQNGFNACEVNGNSKDRDVIISDFASGRYNVICNSMLLTEGWDCPDVDCVIVLRPTKARSLYCQMVGRGTRLAEGKKNLLVLDFLWLTAKHDLCKPSCLMAKNEEVAKKADEIIDLNTAQEFELGEVLDKAEKDAEREREESLAKELEAQRRKKAKCIDFLHYTYSIGREDLADYEPVHPWEMRDATEKQIKYIEDNGVNTEGLNMCAGLASKIIDVLINRGKDGLCTPKQLKTLDKFGYVNAYRYTKKEASTIIGLLAKNRWRASELPPVYRPENYGDDLVEIETW